MGRKTSQFFDSAAESVTCARMFFGVAFGGVPHFLGLYAGKAISGIPSLLIEATTGKDADRLMDSAGEKTGMALAYVPMKVGENVGKAIGLMLSPFYHAVCSQLRERRKLSNEQLARLDDQLKQLYQLDENQQRHLLHEILDGNKKINNLNLSRSCQRVLAEIENMPADEDDDTELSAHLQVIINYMRYQKHGPYYHNGEKLFTVIAKCMQNAIDNPTPPASITLILKHH